MFKPYLKERLTQEYPDLDEATDPYSVFIAPSLMENEVDDPGMDDDQGLGIVESLASLGKEIELLQSMRESVLRYGIGPGMMAFADKDGLLSSTFQSIPSIEALTENHPKGSTTAIAALEGIGEAIKNKLAQWASKAASAGTFLLTKTMAFFKGAYDFGVGFIKTAASKAADSTKALGRTIKAHPYATIIAVLAAIAAACAAIGIIWGFPPSAAGIGGWFTKVGEAFSKIKWPFKGSGVLKAKKVKFDIAAFTKNPGSAYTELTDKIVNGTAVVDRPSLTMRAAGWVKGLPLKAGNWYVNLLKKGIRGSLTSFGKFLQNKWKIWHLVAGIMKAKATIGYLTLSIRLSWFLIKRIIKTGIGIVRSTLSAVGHAITDNGDEAEEGAPA